MKTYFIATDQRSRIWNSKIIFLCCFIFSFFILNFHPLRAGDIPSSSRSQKAELKQKIHLEKALGKQGLKIGSPVFIRVFKEEEELEIWIKNGEKYQLFKIYPICYFSGSLGPKLKEGDHQSPEGFYYVKPRQLNPNSRYHLSFNIGFPNKLDRQLGRTGSHLMIHGSCLSIGCYAMTNSRIEEIWTLVVAALKKSQPFYRVHIFPFRMTDKKMNRHKRSKWINWWKNLKQGYDIFEKNKLPPNVIVKNKKYAFSG